jgi:hypothetical protein
MDGLAGHIREKADQPIATWFEIAGEEAACPFLLL